MGDALAGRRIVVPETRELDVFARMLEHILEHGNHGARGADRFIVAPKAASLPRLGMFADASEG